MTATPPAPSATSALAAPALPLGLRYNPALDSLRGLAVLAVMCRHAIYYFWGEDNTWFSGGFLGVDLFFVLSGFLITRILTDDLDRRGRIDYRTFYRNRVLRLAPALLALLLVHCLYISLAYSPAELEAAGLASIVFYYFNWFLIHTLRVPEGLGHLWSLSVEEQFYLLWPLLLMLLFSLAPSRRTRVLVLAAAMLAVAAWRAQLWLAGESWLALYVRTDCRADSLLIGALLALLNSDNRLPARPAPALTLAAAAALGWLMLTVAREDAFLYLGGFTLVALLCAVLVQAAMTTRKPFYDRVFLRRTGTISYALYLWHVPVFLLTSRQLPGQPAALQAAIALAVTVAICLLSWRYLERPCLQLKARR